MNREQLLNMLERLVREDTLTTEEAGAILRAFDAGEISAEDLPLPPERSRITLEEVSGAAVLALLAERLGTTPDALRSIGQRERRNLSLDLIEMLNERSAAAVRSYAQGGSVQDWHQAMQDVVRDDVVHQATLGKGEALSSQEMEGLQVIMDGRPGEPGQSGYLKKFAEEIAALAALGAGMSEALIRSRSQTYFGKGYEQFWRQSEEQAGPDEIIRYVAIDDNRTCGPCREAEDNGPYLPGEGPMPGEVCLGRGHCRCYRERETNPELAAQLRGEAVAA